MAEARTLLQDVLPTNGAVTRYSDQDLLDGFNGAMVEAYAKRPDLFLSRGLRTPLPFYGAADTGLDFPLDVRFYNAFLYYIVGRTEMREDTFSDDSRATVLMNKFVSQLLMVSS